MFKNVGFRSGIVRPTPEDSQSSRSLAPSGLPSFQGFSSSFSAAAAAAVAVSQRRTVGTFVKALGRRVNWEGLMGRSVTAPTAVAPLLLFHTVINDSRSLATASARTTGGARSLDGKEDRERCQRQRRFDERKDEDSSWKPPSDREYDSCGRWLAS